MRKFHFYILYALLLAIVLSSAWLPVAHADDIVLSTAARRVGMMDFNPELHVCAQPGLPQSSASWPVAHFINKQVPTNRGKDAHHLE